MSLSQSQVSDYGELIITKVGKHRWKVVQDWHTPFGVVPAGFSSDGASIPRPLWWFSHPGAEFFEASIFHDYCYENAIKSKAFADDAFYQIGRHYGAKEFKAKLAKQVVKLLGRGKY